jgi:chromosome segregation protein
MHIEAIVLDNFKSFGRPTRIPFYEDFTTISGPNGSGKSNIVDGILFALGLARTRGIRAEKLTDLIYNPGFDDGESAGGDREASVEVLLDNTDRTLERSQVESAAGTDDVGDVDTISIKRRVKETDENYYSYYYLNGRSVNLSDIQDLLAQAGVTPEGYNVVMQGDVTEIINMTPHSRREIIDEIAGVAEFDAKKEDALEELETVQERVDEAELRIEEKETRLEQLADERETALEYQSLREEKEEYEGHLQAAELEEKRDEREALEDDIAETEAELEALQADLDEKEGAVVRLRDDLAELNEEIQQKGEDEQLEIKSEMEEIKGEISRLETDRDTQEERIEDAQSERQQAFVKIDKKQEEIDDLDDEIRDLKVDKASVQSEIDELVAERTDIEAEIEEKDTAYDDRKERLQSIKERLEAAREAKNEAQREQDRLLDEARRRSQAVEDKEEAIEEAEGRKPDLAEEIAELETELAKAEANHEQIDGVVEDLKDEQRELKDELSALDDEVEAKQAEYAELEAKADGQGEASYGRSVTTILNAGLDGVHGAVGQLGSVDEEYATACETAAGGRLANVVVDDDGVGQTCIDHLKSRNAGRATFLPLTEMDERGLPSLPDDPGVVDFAYNLVDFDAEYAGIFSYVLGSTVVVEDIETARQFMGQYRMVTLEGDLVEKSGAMTGGSSKGSRYSFATGQSKLDRIAERLVELKDERESLREELRDVEERLEDARDRRSDAAEQVREIESDIEARREQREEIAARIEELEADLEELEVERESVDAEMQALEADIDRHGRAVDHLETEVEAIKAELAESEIPALTERIDELNAEIDEREDRQDDLDARLNELQLEKGYAEETIEELNEDIEAAQNRKAEAEERIAEIEDRIEAEEERLAEKEAEVEALEEELVDLKDERADLKSELQDAKEQRDEAKTAVSRVRERREELRARASTLDDEIADLEDVVGDYDPEEIPDHETVTEEIQRLEAEMEALEPVNMRAIEEYDAVEAEYDQLVERRETLVEERDGIEERIESYETQKRETFMDAFEGIDEQFQDIFERLSAGTGELHLENEADPFDGGLTMKAEPGDKPVQRLDAMSGGEKSLTALAFIFAIQRYNPAPFYALDEVDAFLDAANADRVGEMVDELAEDAQFVVVSHRSALLERSERAIGVTMQDNNISAVTGIDIGGGEEVPADD